MTSKNSGSRSTPGESIWFLLSGEHANRRFREGMQKAGRKFSAAELERMKAAEPFHSLVASEGLMIQGRDNGKPRW